MPRKRWGKKAEVREVKRRKLVEATPTETTKLTLLELVQDVLDHPGDQSFVEALYRAKGGKVQQSPASSYPSLGLEDGGSSRPVTPLSQSAHSSKQGPAGGSLPMEHLDPGVDEGTHSSLSLVDQIKAALATQNQQVMAELHTLRGAQLDARRTAGVREKESQTSSQPWGYCRTWSTSRLRLLWSIL